MASVEMISIQEASKRLGMRAETLRNQIIRKQTPFNTWFIRTSSGSHRFFIPRKSFEDWICNGQTSQRKQYLSVYYRHLKSGVMYFKRIANFMLGNPINLSFLPLKCYNKYIILESNLNGNCLDNRAINLSLKGGLLLWDPEQEAFVKKEMYMSFV